MKFCFRQFFHTAFTVLGIAFSISFNSSVHRLKILKCNNSQHTSFAFITFCAGVNPFISKILNRIHYYSLIIKNFVRTVTFSALVLSSNFATTSNFGATLHTMKSDADLSYTCTTVCFSF